MKHLDLFAGIGGFSLAARWMGWNTVAWVEINKYCQQVLKKNFPEAKGYGDIKEFNGTEYRGTTDIITGGFPCQPFSVAGKRKGKEDNRYLWPQMLRVIKEVRPSFIVGENVTGIIGMALEDVLASLEAEGYYTETFIIPACGVGAPHRRDRVWIVAYSDILGSKRWSKLCDWKNKDKEIRSNLLQQINGSGNKRIATNPDFQSLEVGQLKSNGEEQQTTIGSNNRWEIWPTQSGICGRDDGIPNRVDRIKALGNAIVPQVAFEIFKGIETLANYK